MYLLLSFLPLILLIVALADIITREDSQVKHLPKLFWVVLVVILPLVGSILWFVVGRVYPERPVQSQQRSASVGGWRGRGPVAGGHYDAVRGSTGAGTADPRSGDPRSTEQQLADLDREIRFYERKAELQRLQRAAEPRALEPLPQEPPADPHPTDRGTTPRS